MPQDDKNEVVEESFYEKAAKRGINPPILDSMLPPVKGGAISGLDDESVPENLKDVQQELRAIRASIPQMGASIVNARTTNELSQAQVALAQSVKEHINTLNRYALQYAGQVNTRPLESQLSELNKRSFGMQATLGGYGSTQYSAIGSVTDPVRQMTDRMRQGEQISRYQQQQVLQQAALDRARIAADPNLSESVRRNYTSQIATEVRRMESIGRFRTLETPRGMPDEGMVQRVPGLEDRFAGMQNVRGRIEAARDTSGRLTDERQRQLRAEIDLEQRKLRILEQQTRASGDMTKEVQHQFNVQNSELNRTRRDMERGLMPISTGPGVTRLVGSQGGLATLGQGLRELALQRGDVGGTGTLAMLGGMVAQRGIRGSMLGGMEMLGSNAALGIGGLLTRAPLTGAAAGIVGGLGAMATVPIAGIAAAGLAGVLSQVGPAAQHGMEIERLYRAGGAGGGLAARRGIGGVGGFTGGDVGANFLHGYYSELLNSGEGLAFSRDDVLQVAGSLAQTAGTEHPGGLGRERIRPILEFARYMGTGAQETAQQFGLMERNDLLRTPGTPGARPEQDQKRFADLIAQSIAQSGMRGREQEVLGAVTGLTTSIAQRGLDVNVDRIMGLVTTLNTQGGPGLRGQAGQEALSTINEGIIGARGPQQAMLYNIYRRAAGRQGRQLGTMEFLGEQAAGLGSDFAMEGVQGITDLARGNMNLAAGFLTAQYAGGDLHQFGRMRRLAELARDQQLTPEALAQTQQALQAGGGVAGAGIPTGTEGVQQLGNAENLNNAMINLTNSFENAASTLQPFLAGLTGIAGKMMDTINSFISIFGGRSTTEEERARALGGLPPVGGAVGPQRAESQIGAMDRIAPGMRAQIEAAFPGRRNISMNNIKEARNALEILRPPEGTPAREAWDTLNGAQGGPRNVEEATAFWSSQMAANPGPTTGLPGVGAGSNTVATQGVQRVSQTAGNTCSAATLRAIFKAHTGIDISEADVASALGITPDATGNLPGLTWNRVGPAIETLNRRYGTNLQQTPIQSAQTALNLVSRGIPVMFSVNETDKSMTSQAGLLQNHVMGAAGLTPEGNIRTFDSSRRNIGEMTPQQFLGSAGWGSVQSDVRSGIWAIENMSPPVEQTMPGSLDGQNGFPDMDANIFGQQTGGSTQTLSNDANANRNAVIRESLRLGFSPLTALAAIGPEGGFANPMQQEHGPFGNPRQVEPGMGMFQFTNVPPDARGQGGSDTLTRYRNWVRDVKGLDPTSREAWAPELQTEWWFTQYAANRGVTVPGANATPEQIGPALQRIQGPAGNQSARYTAAAREQAQYVQQYLESQQGLPAVDTNEVAAGGGRVNEETTSPSFMPGVTDPDNIFNSVPLGAEGMMAQRQMINIQFGPATITLQDAAGNYLGSSDLVPYTGDAVGLVNSSPTMGSSGYRMEGAA